MITRDLEDLIFKAINNCNRDELAIGFLRYEALRQLTPDQYQKLVGRNNRGENFDEMVNDLVIKKYEKQKTNSTKNK